MQVLPEQSCLHLAVRQKASAIKAVLKASFKGIPTVPFFSILPQLLLLWFLAIP